MLKFVSKFLPTYLHGENSFINWHLDRGVRTRLLCSAHLDLTVASFPIGLSPKTMQDLGSVWYLVFFCFVFFLFIYLFFFF